jgi:hypothetical protein
MWRKIKYSLLLLFSLSFSQWLETMIVVGKKTSSRVL